MKRPLEMKISLNVLEHLGMNLYSTTPAVLSEIVANSWDADATEVSVCLDQKNNTISIQDNGIGMTRDEVVNQFLEIGYRRRIKLGARTPLRKRDPMGRKGIGKLSSFSIARVVSVYTIKDGEKTAFAMDAKKIKKCIEVNDGVGYEPDELDDWPKQFLKGTLIKLTDLQRRTSQLTQKGLRQRLARRFSVIGPKHDFKVVVDGTQVQPSDRGYYERIEYLWTYGDQSELMPFFKNLSQERESVDRTQAINTGDIEITGWIGTVKRPEFLKDDENENLNRIAVFMRGKQAHEDILDGFGEKEIYADYVVGELHCNDLDRDNDEDIATSSRQALKADDPRFQALLKIIHQELRNVAGCWSDWRRRDGARVLTRDIPEVSDWLEELTGDTKKKAERWIGRLNTMRTGKQTEKRELLKASILAFESYRRKEQLDYLDQLTNEDIKPILSVFNDIDDLQLSYYGQIVKLRLGVITALETKLNADKKETVIRDHIFDHLWLLDAGWERVKGSEGAEKSIAKFLQSNSDELTPDEKKGRIDIGYRTVSGRHVIIELKRGSVSTSVDELTRQIRKYRSGAIKLIRKTDYSDWPLDIICLVGTPPPEWHDDPKSVSKQLAALDARLLFYNQLLGSSQQAYADYLEEHKKIDRLWKVFQGIDDFVAAD